MSDPRASVSSVNPADIIQTSASYYERTWTAGSVSGTVEWLGHQRWEAQSSGRFGRGSTPRKAIIDLLKRLGEGGWDQL